MKIKLIRATVVDNQQRAVGDILETDDATARLLLSIKKAEPVLGESRTDRSVGLTTESAAPLVKRSPVKK